MEKMRYMHVRFLPSHTNVWSGEWEMKTFVFIEGRKWFEHQTLLGQLYVEDHTVHIPQLSGTRCNTLATGLFEFPIAGECYWLVPFEWNAEILPAINQFKKDGTPLSKQYFPKFPRPLNPEPEWIKKLEWLRRNRHSGYWL